MAGDQGYDDDERSCFWTWDYTDCAWKSGPFKGRQVKKKKRKGKRKTRGRAFLGEEQAQDSEMWSEEDFVWWTKGRKGKKGVSKGNNQIKSQARIFPEQRQRKVPKEARPQSGLVSL